MFQCKKTIENCFCHLLKEKLHGYSYNNDRGMFKLETKDWFEYIKYNMTLMSEKYQETEYFLILAYLEKHILRNNFRSLKNIEKLNLNK